MIKSYSNEWDGVAYELGIFWLQAKAQIVMSLSGTATMASAFPWRVVVMAKWTAGTVRTRPALTAFRTTRTASCLPLARFLAHMELALLAQTAAMDERTALTVQTNCFVETAIHR